MAQKEKRERFTTPVAEGVYLCLMQPNKKYGNYVAVLAFEPKTNPEHKAFLNRLQKLNVMAFEAVKKGASPKVAKKLTVPRVLIKPEEDDQGDVTGRMLVTFRQKAEVKSTKAGGKVYNFHVAVFDAKGKPVPASLRIGGGTKAIVSFEVRPTLYETGNDAGANLTLVAAQIIELVEWSGANAESYGFTEVEDGYSAEGASDDDDDDDEKDEDEETAETQADEDEDPSPDF